MKSLKSQIYYVKTIQILLPTFAILAGGLIYIYFRKSDFIFFQWIEYLGYTDWLIKLQEAPLFENSILPAWIIFSLPSGLWAFAYTNIIVIIWFKSPSRIRFFWYCSIPLLIFGFEVFQSVNIIPGTFSFLDVLFSFLGILLGVFIGIKS